MWIWGRHPSSNSEETYSMQQKEIQGDANGAKKRKERADIQNNG